MVKQVRKVEIPAHTLYECGICSARYTTEKKAEICNSKGIDLIIKPGLTYEYAPLSNSRYLAFGIIVDCDNKIFKGNSDINTSFPHPRRIATFRYSLSGNGSLIMSSPYDEDDTSTFRWRFARGKNRILEPHQREFIQETIQRYESDSPNPDRAQIVLLKARLLGRANDLEKDSLTDLLYFDHPIIEDVLKDPMRYVNLV